MKKRCRIYASLPITCFEVPIVGDTELNLTENEIYKCLCAKAEVIEILPDGKRINLDFTNYNKNNYELEDTITTEPVVIETIEEEPEPAPVEEEKVEEPVEVIEEAVEAEPVEETIETIEEEPVEVIEEENTVEEVKDESPVAETVKNYQTNSRNNNYNNKKSKNKR